MRSLILAVISACILFSFSACKKTSPWNFNNAVSATFGGQTYSYVAPAGIVNYGTYEVNAYQSNTTANTLVFNLTDSPYSRIDTFGSGSGNSLVIVNNGVTYTTSYGTGVNATLNLSVSGNKVTGTFSGTLNSTSSGNITVTNGTLSTTY
jgi:hypothetical protein